MALDRITLTLPTAKLTAIDNALVALETALTELVALEPEDRKRLPKMGDKSEAFCRQTLTVMAQNPQIVNPSLGLPAAQADLAVLKIGHAYDLASGHARVKSPLLSENAKQP